MRLSRNDIKYLKTLIELKNFLNFIRFRNISIFIIARFLHRAMR